MPSGRSFVDPAEAPSACWRTLPGNGPHKSKALPGLLGLLFQASTVTSSTRHAADNAAAAVNTRLYKLQWVLNKISQPAAPLLRPEPRAAGSAYHVPRDHVSWVSGLYGLCSLFVLGCQPAETTLCGERREREREDRRQTKQAAGSCSLLRRGDYLGFESRGERGAQKDAPYLPPSPAPFPVPRKAPEEGGRYTWLWLWQHPESAPGCAPPPPRGRRAHCRIAHWGGREQGTKPGAGGVYWFCQRPPELEGPGQIAPSWISLTGGSEPRRRKK
jgi:hypothetical protein